MTDAATAAYEAVEAANRKFEAIVAYMNAAQKEGNAIAQGRAARALVFAGEAVKAAQDAYVAAVRADAHLTGKPINLTD